jgi:hypothetical protein
VTAIENRVTVRERIDPGITASLFSNYRSAADAVMELVDNALDSRIAGSRLTIELAVHPTWIIVHCGGGSGMGPKELEKNYLRWGGSPKRGRNLLGQYGQGGKAAIGHLGAQFLVEASRPRDDIAWRFQDADYRDRSRLKTYVLERVAKRTDRAHGYVRIRIDGVDKRIDPRRISARLSDTYRPLLESEAVIMTLNGNPLQPLPVAALERRGFRVRAAGSIVSGWAGIVDPGQRATDFVPGIRCYKLGRLITQGETFGHPSVAQVPGMAQLIGEVDIPRVPLTMNKSDFDRDSPEWVAVESRLHAVLHPLATRLARRGQAPPPRSALRAAEQARLLLSQALRLADRPDLFPGVSSGGRLKTERDTVTELLPFGTLALEKTEEARAPSKPQIKNPASSGSQRRGFGAIKISALDPAVRSHLVVEDGTAYVVINSQYPLFVERGGDIWYQLETAIREICRAVEGVQVSEYERRINEVLLAAFRLQRRGRHSGRGGRVHRTKQLNLVG